MENQIYDVIVIGGGPAGLTSAIYCSRKKMKTLMVTVNIGGQVNLTTHIENYPGFVKIDGIELSRVMEEQMKNFDTEIIFGKVDYVNRADGYFVVGLANGEKYSTRAIILAFGKIPRSLGIPGEDRFAGRGISSCAICDAALFRDKVASVVGGGNSALEAAEILSRFASKIYLIHRQDVFRGDESTLERVRSNPRIDMITNSIVTEIMGDKFVSGIIIQDVRTGSKKELKVDGMFVEIGYETRTEWVKNLVSLNELGEVIINERGETSQPGVFAAGDVASGPFKQLVIAAGQGAVAALSAYNYLQKVSGGRELKSDWGKIQK